MRAALLALVAALSSSGAAHAAERATADRQDDLSGSQIHFVYAVPADAPDRALDRDGTIAASARLLVEWAAQQMDGYRLRLDTAAGEPDVTFVRLRLTAADAARADGNERVKEELATAGLGAPRKLYAVWVEGRGSSCAAAQHRGTIATLYLWQRCSYDEEATRAGRANFLEYVMLHELLHAFGAVPTCAPHYRPGSHTSDDPRDLMHGGSQPDWVAGPIVDPGRDDYFRHGRVGCPDVSRSPYLAPPGTSRALLSVADGKGAIVGAGPACSATTCEVDVAPAVPVALTPVPAPGFAFAGWQGACAGAGPCVLTGAAPAAVGAVFRAARHRLVVSFAGPGVVVLGGRPCSSPCAATASHGSTLSVRALPRPGARFVGWSGACGRAPVCRVSLVRPLVLRARFAPAH